jgi:hypothetical protein
MPCWPRPDTSCCDRLNPANPTAEQTAQIERILQVSTEIIWRLSGKQFGACPVTVRPCRKTCARGFTGYWSDIGWMPVLENGVWFNQNCDRCRPSGCSCSELCEVDLPGPVVEIQSVTLNGEILPADHYRVDDFRRLVRVKGWNDVVVGKPGIGHSYEEIPTEDDGVWCFDRPSTNVGLNSLNDPQDANGCYIVGPPANDVDFISFAPTSSLTASYDDTSGDGVLITMVDGFDSDPSPVLYRPAITGVTYNAGDVVRFFAEGDPTKSVLLRMTAGSATTVGVAPFISLNLDPGAAFAVTYQELGPACWPTCQDMAAPLTDDGTWGVTYRRGAVVPQSGQWAAGLLACELYKACTGEGECALPSNAQRIARQGVTVELTPVLVKPGEFATGIPEVDLWLNSVNPYRAKLPSAVFSPDRPAPVMTTWPCA